MIVRLLISASLLTAIALLGVGFGGSADSLRPSPVAAAPAATTVDGLDFSHGITSDAQPVNPDIEYGKGENKVWVSFNYRDHNPATKVSYLVRAGGKDYVWGRLDCCSSGSGRFAFPIERRNGGQLAGAAYDVRIYVSDVEVAHGGFGVKGKQGLDNGDAESNDHPGNDNN
jgi:hypothetical protein